MNKPNKNGQMLKHCWNLICLQKLLSGISSILHIDKQNEIIFFGKVENAPKNRSNGASGMNDNIKICQK